MVNPHNKNKCYLIADKAIVFNFIRKVVEVNDPTKTTGKVCKHYTAGEVNGSLKDFFLIPVK